MSAEEFIQSHVPGSGNESGNKDQPNPTKEITKDFKETKKEEDKNVVPTKGFADLASLSKNQRKKLLKRQKYLEEKKDRKLKKKEKQKEKKLKRQLEGGDTDPQGPIKKFKSMDSEDALPIRIVIDLNFDDLMSDRDMLKLMKQVQRCYAVNRRADHPVQMYLTSFEGKSRSRLDHIGCHYDRWDVNIKSEHLTKVFPKEDIIYLTSDSPNMLTELDMSKVYVIGGLVDHNHHKGYCYDQAVKQGFQHAQLPIGEFIKIATRKVLTVNHVFEILVRYCESKDWKEAFFHVMPQRKIVPKVRRRGKRAERDGAANSTDGDKNDDNCDDVTKDDNGGDVTNDDDGDDFTNDDNGDDFTNDDNDDYSDDGNGGDG